MTSTITLEILNWEEIRPVARAGETLIPADHSMAIVHLRIPGRNVPFAAAMHGNDFRMILEATQPQVKSDIAAKPSEPLTTMSPHCCEHANEAPMTCPCPDNCYCKQHTCKNVRGYRMSSRV